MPQHHKLLRTLEQDVASRRAPLSVAEAFEQLSPLSIGLRQKIPVLPEGARMFRIRKLPAKPQLITEVGAPPAGHVRVGRLNDRGQSVLYLADSPDTAFAEAGVINGQYCLSEWRTQPPKVGLANGGLDSAFLALHFPKDFDSPDAIRRGGTEDPDVLAFFTSIFTLSVGADKDLYRWSIACGMMNGFAHICGRTGIEHRGGKTKLTGKYPFSGIAYRSTRKDQPSINYAFNDLGQSYVRLNHVQWVERLSDGSFSSLDIASAWNEQGVLRWEGRPAHYQLRQGREARLTKVGENSWTFENLDGSIPFFV